MSQTYILILNQNINLLTEAYIWTVDLSFLFPIIPNDIALFKRSRSSLWSHHQFQASFFKVRGLTFQESVLHLVTVQSVKSISTLTHMFKTFDPSSRIHTRLCVIFRSKFSHGNGAINLKVRSNLMWWGYSH